MHDITPQPTPIRARLASEECDNRYGAVVSALYSFWKSREGHQVTSSSVVREDHYSVVAFDDEAEARVENDWRLTTNQLVDKLIPQEHVSCGGTDFEKAIEVAHEVLERSWSSQRAPILVFLSDGEGWINEESIRNLCNLSVKLGQALAFYAISFGLDTESDPLRLMVSVAEQVFQSAPASAKDSIIEHLPEDLKLIAKAEGFGDQQKWSIWKIFMIKHDDESQELGMMKVVFFSSNAE
ncbi:von willebrand factor type A domain protein, partial [Rhizoctonia solani AG-3 Rhs1AP]